jgi:hypothetical protein
MVFFVLYDIFMFLFLKSLVIVLVSLPMYVTDMLWYDSFHKYINDVVFHLRMACRGRNM